MRRSSKPAYLLAFCALAFGQTPAAPSDEKPANVQGIVANSITGEPLLRAHVALRSLVNGPQSAQKKYGAVTTAEGKFSITGMDSGRYSVAIDKVGFVSSTDQPMITLQAGDQKEDLKFKLIPTGGIAGRVVNAEGEPLENATVTVENSPNGNGAVTSSDEKGQFRVGGLTPGRYRVRASPQNLPFPPETRTDGTKEIHYAPTYYPAALLPRSAVRVEARPGNDTSGIDIRLVATPIVRVSGTLSGLPAGTQNAQVEARKGRNSTSGAAVKPDGTFEIWKLDPGKYTIVASWNGQGGARMQSTPADVEISDSNVDRVALNALPPIDLAGHVEFEDEKARPQQPTPQQQQQMRQASPPGSRPMPRRINFTSVDSFGGPPVELAADDSFQLTNLSPARYRVNPGWGPAYVKSMRLGPTQIDGSVLDLRNGAAGTALTLVMSSAIGEISGTVSDEHGPVGTATVALVTDDWESGPPYRYAPTKPDGTYTIAAVAPGRYKIAAVDEVDRAMLMRGGGVEDYLDQMEAIDVRANDKLVKDLKRRKP